MNWTSIDTTTSLDALAGARRGSGSAADGPPDLFQELLRQPSTPAFDSAKATPKPEPARPTAGETRPAPAKSDESKADCRAAEPAENDDSSSTDPAAANATTTEPRGENSIAKPAEDSESEATTGQNQDEEKAEAEAVIALLAVANAAHDVPVEEPAAELTVSAAAEKLLTQEPAVVSDAVATKAELTLAPEHLAKEVKEEKLGEKQVVAAGKRNRATKTVSSEHEVAPEIERKAGVEGKKEESGHTDQEKREGEIALGEGWQIVEESTPARHEVRAEHAKVEAAIDSLTPAETPTGSTAETAAPSDSPPDSKASPVADAPKSPTTPRHDATPNHLPPLASRLQESIVGRGPERTNHASRASDTDPARFLTRVAKAFQSAQQRDGEVRIRLNPPELGSLKIEIRVEQGVMRASVEAETPRAQALLVDNLPALKERLAEQNIRVDQFDVDLLDRRQQDPGGEEARNSASANSLRNSSNNSTTSEHSETPRSRGIANDGRLNVIV